MWPGHDTALVINAVLAIALVVVLVAVVQLHAFLGVDDRRDRDGTRGWPGVTKLVKSFEGGVGSVLGNVGLVLALGTMRGKLRAESGGADRIAQAVLSRAGARGAPWAMALVAMIVGIPLFFEIGVVLLIPIIFTLARRVHDGGIGKGGNAYLLVGIPALAELSVLHGLVPPHPGPLIAINTVGGEPRSGARRAPRQARRPPPGGR